MALQLWLPLNGTLENRGLSNVTASSTGATVSATGKIGPCYYLAGNTSSYIDTGFSSAFGTGDYSIAMWVKIPRITSGSYFAIISSKGAGAAASGVGIYWNYSQKRFLWSSADGTNAREIWMSTSVDLTELVYDKWIHIILVRNSSDAKHGYFYINGERYDLMSVPSILNITTDTKFRIGNCVPSYYSVKMYVNDLRIYDHAVSVKEAKELSKALTIHYTLDNAVSGVYDCSGYCNNATAKDITYDAESPRHGSCSQFTGTNSSYIKTTENNWMAQYAEEMTINLWAYSDNWASQPNAHLFSCTEGGGFNTESGSSGYLRTPIYVATNSAQNSHAYHYDSQEVKISDLSAGWHMFTFVYTIAGHTTYIDGELHHTYTNQNYGIRFNTSARLFLGCEANGASSYVPYLTGKESDFRLYYTALSSEDILELYEVTASADRDNNFYTYEYVESDNSKSFLRNGELLIDDINEDSDGVSVSRDCVLNAQTINEI